MDLVPIASAVLVPACRAGVGECASDHVGRRCRQGERCRARDGKVAREVRAMRDGQPDINRYKGVVYEPKAEGRYFFDPFFWQRKIVPATIIANAT